MPNKKSADPISELVGNFVNDLQQIVRSTLVHDLLRTLDGSSKSSKPKKVNTKRSRAIKAAWKKRKAAAAAKKKSSRKPRHKKTQKHKPKKSKIS